MTGNEVKRILRAHMEAIRALGVDRLRLFGSAQSGILDPGSDIDLLVDFAPGLKNFDSYMNVKILLEDLFPGRKIDLVTTESLHPKLRPGVIRQAELVP